MLSWDRPYLTPPVFEDEDKNQLARLLYPIVAFCVVSTGVALLGLALIPVERSNHSAVFVGVAFLLGIVFLLLLHRGNVRAVGLGIGRFLSPRMQQPG